MIPSVTYEILHSDNPFQIPGLLLTLKTVFGKSDDTTLHWHSGTELLYVLDGTITYTNSGIRQAITTGEFAIINSNVIHQFQNTHADRSNTTLTLILPDIWMRQFSTEEKPVLVSGRDRCCSQKNCLCTPTINHLHYLTRSLPQSAPSA